MSHSVGAPDFTGDFVARGVESIAADLETFRFDPGSVLLGAPLNLKLETDAGTPGDESDDYAAFFFGGLDQATPPPLAGWQRVTFAIPSENPSLPPGWIIS